ncbi:MAG: hypothetical protein ACWA5X_07595 [bacterium]
MNNPVTPFLRTPSLIVPATLALGLLATSTASALTIESGSQWKSTNIAPTSAWKTEGFDDSSWRNAVYPYGPTPTQFPVPAMWDWPNAGPAVYGSGPIEAWFRYEFNLSGPVSSAEVTLLVDDNFELFLNNSTVYLDHGPGASVEGPFDISNLLTQGTNVFAIYGWDGGASPRNRGGEGVSFKADITTVPLPAAAWMFGGGLALLGGVSAKWRRNRHSQGLSRC